MPVLWSEPFRATPGTESAPEESSAPATSSEAEAYCQEIELDSSSYLSRLSRRSELKKSAWHKRLLQEKLLRKQQKRSAW